jgi:predicted SprT family Zn-dependent metalloprotease
LLSGEIVPDKLNDMYELLNKKHFNGGLPRINVAWNSRYRTRAGSAHYIREAGSKIFKPTHISLNKRLLMENEENLRLTLIHEMVHVWRVHTTGRKCGHDTAFQAKMDMIVGYRDSHTYHNYDVSDLKEDKKIAYVCPVHNVIGHRARMPRAYHMNSYFCNITGDDGRECRRQITFLDQRNKAHKRSGVSIKLRRRI